MEPIVNKIASSGIITIDLAEFLPQEPIVAIDLKPFLFRELILREKDFREALKTHDWEQYRNKPVTIYCSTDAIIPMWAYMLMTTYLEPTASSIQYGDISAAGRNMMLSAIDEMDITPFTDQRIIIKGCGEKPVPADAYVAIMKKLKPVVKSLMFGEPCSTVPVYKRKNN